MHGWMRSCIERAFTFLCNYFYPFAFVCPTACWCPALCNPASSAQLPLVVVYCGSVLLLLLLTDRMMDGMDWLTYGAYA
ncbi:hypothetical protein M747DRAFT_104024 [Aspergillus niger ATCC 13496]|uniref:Uncharacterized protein n=1 Tax=Aspergillus niger ATCC 13496 TaxID=1353008 RepID=A0A370BVW6_ASPNG|nr:hypothetical protein M747DRAFT_104024 [Aspergillus niger ATCC 13496]